MQQQCATLLGQALRGQAAAAVQPCGAQLSLLPRLRLTQPLRSQALNGHRHMLPVNLSSSSSTVGRAFHSGTSSSSSRQLLQPGGRQAAWRGWMQQQLGGSSASSSSSRVFLRLRSGFSSAAPASAPGGSKAAAAAALPSWGAAGGVASWFNHMPAAAAWWDSWMLWVGSQASFVMATLLNSLNTVGNKLPVALGLLLVDWVHHSPLLHGSRADALHPPALPNKLPEGGGFYAATKAAGSSSSSSVWRTTARGAAAAWSELLAGLSAGARLLWLGCIWLPALLSAPLILGCCGPTGRSWWLGLITLSLEASGPAFIKWGQVGVFLWGVCRGDQSQVDAFTTGRYSPHCLGFGGGDGGGGVEGME